MIEVQPLAPGRRQARILAGLNEQQHAVVTAGEGPILVVAGAGSGKTTALTRRVAYLIDQGVRPESILLLTFTRAAAQSMLARAVGLTEEAERVVGGTFHAFSAQILREAHAAFGLPRNFSILDPGDVNDAIKHCVADVPLEDQFANKPQASTIAKIVSFAANTGYSIAKATVAKAPEWIARNDWIEAVQKRYVRYKLDRGLLDYDDLLIYLGHLLDDANLGAQVRNRFSHILVDEHQDSNAAQLRIVYGLGGTRGNVLAVGDPAQAIYGFRGSAPGTMFDFVRHWPEAKVLNLDVNYRSTQRILDLVNAVDRSMTERFDRQLRPAGAADSVPPRLVSCTDPRHEAEEICARIIESKDEGGRLRDHAVLVRSMYVSLRLQTAFKAHQIPYIVKGGIRIDEAAHVKDLLSVARIAANPQHEPAWMRALECLPKIGAKSAAAIVAHVARAGDAEEAAKLLAGAPCPKRADVQPLVKALRAVSSPGPLPTCLKSAIKAYDSVFEASYKESWPDRRRDLEALANIAGDYESLTDFLSTVTLDYALDKKEKSDPEAKADEDPVTLSTIHSAKGLEWKTVHVLEFKAGHFPSSFALTAEEIEEERRLLYVASSRAMEELIYYKAVFSDSGAMQEDSPFLEVIAPWLELEKATRPAEEAAFVPFEIRSPIDMRAKLLGR